MDGKGRSSLALEHAFLPITAKLFADASSRHPKVQSGAIYLMSTVLMDRSTTSARYSISRARPLSSWRPPLPPPVSISTRD